MELCFFKYTNHKYDLNYSKSHLATTRFHHDREQLRQVFFFLIHFLYTIETLDNHYYQVKVKKYMFSLYHGRKTSSSHLTCFSSICTQYQVSRIKSHIH